MATNRWAAMTASEQIARAAAMLDRTPMAGALAGLDAFELLKLAEMCLRSEWDVGPGDLTPDEGVAAMRSDLATLNRSLAWRYERTGSDPFPSLPTLGDVSLSESATAVIAAAHKVGSVPDAHARRAVDDVADLLRAGLLTTKRGGAPTRTFYVLTDKGKAAAAARFGINPRAKRSKTKAP